MKNNELISPERGVFYSYSANFSSETPLYFLQKCKANKGGSMPCGNPDETIRELDLVFLFDGKVSVCSPHSESSMKLLTKEFSISQDLNSSEIKIADITSDEFYDCHKKKESSILVETFDNASNADSPILLSTNMVLSVKTKSGKYAAILIKELSETAISVDACHILL